MRFTDKATPEKAALLAKGLTGRTACLAEARDQSCDLRAEGNIDFVQTFAFSDLISAQPRAASGSASSGDIMTTRSVGIKSESPDIKWT